MIIYNILLRYSINDFPNENKFQVNVSLKICFESSKPCLLEIPVFSNTKLPKKVCDWTTDFLDPGRSK